MDTAHLNFSSCQGAEGSATKILQLMQEVEEKTKQLDRVSHYLDSIVKNISEGLIFVSHTGIITTYNPAAEKILGMRQKDVLYRSFAEIFSDQSFGFSMSHAIKKMDCPGMNFAKYIYKGKYEKELEVSTSPVFRRGRSQKGIILLLRDITRQRYLIKREEQDRRLKEIGQMAATVAHEIRNPLGGIEGFASLLEKDLKDDHPHWSKMARYIIEGSRTISLLIENLLRSARPLSPQLADMDIVILCHEIKEQLELEKGIRKEVEVILESYHPSICLLADRSMIRSSIMHLIRNAIDSIENEGQVHLTLFTKEQNVVVTIKDSGRGIAKEHMERLFTPFFTTKEKGTGLGLYETYRMIQSHGGHIDVKSSEECGTLFIITLPVKGFLS